MTRGFRLRSLALLWVALAMVSASAATVLWLRSTQSWADHLATAQTAGLLTYEALRTGQDTHPDLNVSPLSASDAALAETGKFERITGMPQPAYVTVLSLQNREGGLRIGAVSDVLQYPVADIPADIVPTASAQLAALTRLFATYCSDPILIARLGNGPWQQVDGNAIWGCDDAPRDLRLLAVLVGLVAVAALVTMIGNTTQSFDAFAQAFRNRRFGGPDSYETTGPGELRDIVESLNAFIEAERKQLANRAAVLSSVSHDLGTPATRLRLRTALIEDADLRGKLEADIDQMTGIIDSVLTYTRSELGSEEAREISLTALVQAVVSDFEDMGQPVEMCAAAPTEMGVTGERGDRHGPLQICYRSHTDCRACACRSGGAGCAGVPCGIFVCWRRRDVCADRGQADREPHTGHVFSGRPWLVRELPAQAAFPGRGADAEHPCDGTLRRGALDHRAGVETQLVLSALNSSWRSSSTLQ